MNLEGYSKETIASWDSYTPITLSCASLLQLYKLKFSIS